MAVVLDLAFKEILKLPWSESPKDTITILSRKHHHHAVCKICDLSLEHVGWLTSHVVPVAVLAEELSISFLVDLLLAIWTGACEIEHLLLLCLELHHSGVHVEEVSLVHIVLLLNSLLDLCD